MCINTDYIVAQGELELASALGPGPSVADGVGHSGFWMLVSSEQLVGFISAQHHW